jgi:hypothetical protein
MAYHILLILIGGIIGWLLFIWSTFYTLRSKYHQLKMINKIEENLKIAKEELQKLK